MDRLSTNEWVTSSDGGKFTIKKLGKGQYALYDNFSEEKVVGDINSPLQKELGTFASKVEAVREIVKHQGGGRPKKHASEKRGKYDFEKVEGIHYILGRDSDKGKWYPVDQSGGSTSAEAVAKRLRDTKSYHEVKVVTGTEYYQMLNGVTEEKIASVR